MRDPSALLRLSALARGIATRGVVTRVRTAKGLAQAVQVQVAGSPAGPQVLDLIDQAQPYGLSARPLEGAEAVLLALGGSREATVAVQVADRRYRRKGLKAGEVYLHNDADDYVGLRQGGLVHLVGSTEVRITAPLVKIEGDLQVTGEVADGHGVFAQTMEEMRQRYNLHNHPGAAGPPDLLM